MNRRRQPDNIEYNSRDEQEALLGENIQNIHDVNPNRHKVVSSDWRPAQSVSQRKSRGVNLSDIKLTAGCSVGASQVHITDIPSSSTQLHNYGDSHEFGSDHRTYSRTIGFSDESPRSSSDFIYYTVQPNDTLQTLSVKYSCPVASIKRLNHIWNDQELYARSKVKLPVGKFRLLDDVIQEEIQKSTSASGSIVANNNDLTYPSDSLIRDESQSILANELSGNLIDFNSNASDYNQSLTRNSGGSSNVVFRTTDKNIEKARAAAQLYEAHAQDIMQTLAEGGNIVHDIDNYSSDIKQARREAETLLIDMSDNGLSYSCLILFVFIVCLICPLAYVIYLEETTLHSLESNKAL